MVYPYHCAECNINTVQAIWLILLLCVCAWAGRQAQARAHTHPPDLLPRERSTMVVLILSAAAICVRPASPILLPACSKDTSANTVRKGRQDVQLHAGVRVCVRERVHVHVRVRVNRVGMFACMCLCVSVCACMCSCMRACACACVRASKRAC